MFLIDNFEIVISSYEMNIDSIISAEARDKNIF